MSERIKKKSVTLPPLEELRTKQWMPSARKYLIKLDKEIRTRFKKGRLSEEEAVSMHTGFIEECEEASTTDFVWPKDIILVLRIKENNSRRSSIVNRTLADIFQEDKE